MRKQCYMDKGLVDSFALTCISQFFSVMSDLLHLLLLVFISIFAPWRMLSLISSLSAPLHLAPHRMAQELVEHVHIAENHLYDYFHFFAQRINSVAKEVDTYGVMNWQWGSYTQARNWEDDESVIAEKTCLRVYNKRMRNVLKEAEKLNDEVTE